MAKTYVPESWHTPEIRRLLIQDLDFPLTGLELLVIHAHICLAITHPAATGPATVAAEALLLRIETLLESLGVPAPSPGWRALVPEEPA